MPGTSLGILGPSSQSLLIIYWERQTSLSMSGVLSAIRKKGRGARMVGRHLSEIWATSRWSEETNPVTHFGSRAAGAEGGMCPWQVQEQTLWFQGREWDGQRWQ